MNIEINSIAELSIDELEKIEKKEKINRITVLGHHKTSVSPRDYKRIYRKMQELTDGIQQDWSRTKKFVLIYRRISRNIVYDYAAAYPKGAIQAVYSEKETEYKDFAYTPNMKRQISIIDMETTEEVKPVLYFDEEANEVKGKCKLKPYRKYFAFEVREKKN